MTAPKTRFSVQNQGHIIHGDSNSRVADWMRQHPNSEEALRDPVVYDEAGDWNQDTRWSLRNQTDLETGRSQQSGAVNLNKEDEDTRTRFGVTASMNEQRRGDESIRTLTGGFSGSGEQETSFGDITAQSSGSVTRGADGRPSMRAQSSLGLKREDSSGAEWAGNVTARADSDRNTGFQGSIQRKSKVDDWNLQEQMNVSGSGFRATRARNNFGSDVEHDMLDSGFNRRIERNRTGSRIGLDLGSDLSLDGALSRTRRQTSWNRDGVSANMSLLKGSANGRIRDRSMSIDAQADLWEANASLRRKHRRRLFDEDFEATGTLSGHADIGAQAKTKADFERGVDAEFDAFTGARAEASLRGELEWDRRDDYSDVLRDHFDNFPGQWDDRLLERVPDRALQRAGQVLFGKGRTKLASGTLGVDARAGVGVNGSASATLDDSGMIELGGSIGGAVGVGGGVSARGGVNPVAVGRLGVLKGMEQVNQGYAGLEQVTRNVKDRAAQDTALIGEKIEESAERQGPFSKLARMLLRMDKAARGRK